MPDNLESLLELIEKAQAIAELQGQSTIAYFLSVAAHTALEEKRLQAARPKPFAMLPFKRRQWATGRWLPR